MVKRTLPQNPAILNVAKDLKELYVKDQKPIWKKVYNDIMKQTRKRRVVNLVRLDKFTKENDIVIIPGKLLGVGDITKKITVAPLLISDKAANKLLKAKCSIVSINDIAKKNPKGTNIKIIG